MANATDYTSAEKNCQGHPLSTIVILAIMLGITWLGILPVAMSLTYECTSQKLLNDILAEPKETQYDLVVRRAESWYMDVDEPYVRYRGWRLWGLVY